MHANVPPSHSPSCDHTNNSWKRVLLSAERKSLPGSYDYILRKLGNFSQNLKYFVPLCCHPIIEQFFTYLPQRGKLSVP